MNIIPRGEIRTMKMIFFLLIHVQVDFSYKKHSALRKHDFLYFFILFLFHFFFNLFTRLQHFKMALLRHCTYNKSVFSASFWKKIDFWSTNIIQISRRAGEGDFLLLLPLSCPLTHLCGLKKRRKKLSTLK